MFKNGVLIAFLAFLADQISKVYIQKLPEGFSVLDGFISLKISETLNTVLAFSINAPVWIIYAIIIPVFLFVFIAWVISAVKKEPESLWIALVLGGGAGNFNDRITHGGVIDWIEFSIGTFHWSSFNLADAFIVIGAIGWIIHSSRRKQQIQT